MKHIQSNPVNQIGTQETQDGFNLPLLAIFSFLKSSWKIILLFGFLGIIISIAYITIAPKLYEATAQIRLAQISLVNPANPFGTPVEDPASLISRMQFPTNYSANVIRACGFQDNMQAGLVLSKTLKFSTLKGVANTIELKVITPNSQMSFDCANAVFLQMQILQEQMSLPFVEEAKAKLITDNERIEAARKLIAKADQSGSAMSAAYLSARDELTYFLTDREKMTDLINSVKNRGTRLASPIYAAEREVSPKKITSLAVGLLGGLFLGFVIALAIKFWASLNRKKTNWA